LLRISRLRRYTEARRDCQSLMLRRQIPEERRNYAVGYAVGGARARPGSHAVVS
jgi:hypothetical protein